ncbi:MAG TPA: 4-carboxy-4-hydroxy-2-oxoadipate aldolase/oxaloacetate decarboxylase [Candidatus Acidoferrales bacterium]|nr:4-carboxy-4-hydroxy-2-oxoadipate aldolase/oxaloacetate decarboxylase [Candidatus Acidoferrales bacterium]
MSQTAPPSDTPLDFPRADGALLRRFEKLPATTVSDAMERLGVIDSQIRPVWSKAAVVGSAFTVLTRPGDNLYIHKALEQVRPGDVLVVNGLGDEKRALIGSLVAAKAKSLGVAGFVIDGAVRDREGLEELGMPVFARAVTPAGPYKNGPGRLNVAIAIGGQVVMPGDVVVADADGVVIVPLAEAGAVVVDAEAKLAQELAGG